MGLFDKKGDGGLLDVIRCDETEYLIWKWRPSGDATSTRKENAIRWGSSLRVKDGEVAVFVYSQQGGPSQDYIEGPFDDIIKTANFPIISNILGLAYAGKSPFQAEIYFINLAGNLDRTFRVPYFNVYDYRYPDWPVRFSAQGNFVFNITDYKAFIKLHRLINFEMDDFANTLQSALIGLVKSEVMNTARANNIPVLQIESQIDLVRENLQTKLKPVFLETYGVNLKRFNLQFIEPDKSDDGYRRFIEYTRGLQEGQLAKQAEVNMLNMEDTQAINATNMSETLRIQRDQAERFARLQTEQQFLGAHQIDQQASVLKTAAANLGEMGQMNLGTGGGGFNPAGVMTGMAVGGAMGGQMANMMNISGQNIQQPMMAPPPLPQVTYHVSINGQNAGPFNMGQLQQMTAAGQLNKDVYVWKQGMANWEVAGNVAELAALFAQAAVPPPPMPPTPPTP